MTTVPLGTTRAAVSAMALGTAYFGTTVSEDAAFAVLDAYVATGGTFIDTANMYAGWVPGGRGGESEAVVGRWMKDRRNRFRLFVATKVGLPYDGVAEGLRAATIREECERSLKRLGVEQIDLYYTHRDDRATPAEEFMAALDGLVRQGKVRHLGASNITAWRLVECNWIARTRGLAEYACLQQRFTYLRPRPNVDFAPQVPVTEEMLDCLRAHGMPLVCYGPLLKGTIDHPTKPLDPRYAWADTDARLAALRAVVAEVGATANQTILAWMLRLSPRVIPLFSASRPGQVRENLAALNVRLTNEQMARLNQSGV